jgi:hypothetical protein
MFLDYGCDDMVVQEIFKELHLKESMNNNSMKLMGVIEPFQKRIKPPPKKVNQ